MIRAMRKLRHSDRRGATSVEFAICAQVIFVNSTRGIFSWKRKSNLMITVRYIAMVSAETTCPSPMPADWSQVASTGKFYKIVLESLSWYDARQTCLDAGMDMFNTETREEADLVRHHGGYICCKSILSWR